MLGGLLVRTCFFKDQYVRHPSQVVQEFVPPNWIKGFLFGFRVLAQPHHLGWSKRRRILNPNPSFPSGQLPKSAPCWSFAREWSQQRGTPACIPSKKVDEASSLSGASRVGLGSAFPIAGSAVPNGRDWTWLVRSC